MKKFYNTRLLLLLCLVLSFGIITSCGDDDDVDPTSGQVQLLSFGPTGVQHGEEIRFIGRNLKQVESIEFAGATVSKASFLEHTSELIRVIVPDEAMEGLVTLKLSKGDDVVSKTILSFEVPITIASVTEEAKPGTNITITGTKLNWVEGVVFDKDTVDEFVSQSASELVLQVPMTAKTGTLLLLGGGTEPMAVETENELIVTLPKMTAMAPASINTGANLTITGTDLDLVKEILFTGVGEARATTFVSQTPTQIVVEVPSNAKTGELKLVAHSDVEVPTTVELTVILPEVTALSGPVKHSENLTITGTNLNLVKEVRFTGVGEAKMTTFVRQTPTELVVKVPDNASSGNLTLVAKSGVVVAPTHQVAVVLPAITSLSPSPIDPGQNLTISGTNLDLVKSIEFQGGTAVSNFVSQSPTRIVVTVPMNAKKGALKITTIKDYVIETTAQVTIILPVITDVTPDPVIVGNYLTISGRDLNLVKSVVFTGGATVSTFLAQNDNQIVLTVPASAQTGVLKLITHSNFEVTTDKRANIGTAAPNITTYIYNEALNTAANQTWQKWGGWGTATQDMENTEQVSRGSKAIKVVYNDPYGALQLHPTNPNILSGHTHLVLYVRGGSQDSRVAIQVKNSADATSADVPFDVKKDEWRLIEIPISQLGNVSGGIKELYIKNYGANPNTIYIDDIGLR